MKHPKKSMHGLFATLMAGLLLSACGGGGSGSNANSTPHTGTNPAPDTTMAAPNTPSEQPGNGALLTPAGRVGQAMSNGNSQQLKAEDAPYLLTTAQENYAQVLDAQNNLLSAFYAGAASTQFDMVQESYMVQPSLLAMDQVFPLVVGDKGNVLASISTVAGNRIAGYGYDILAGFSPQSKQQIEFNVLQTAHQTVFKRVLAWLVTGNATADITSSSATPFSVAWGSLPTSSTVMYTTPSPANRKVYEPYAVAGMRSLGVKFANMTCDPLAEPVDTCAALANLVVIGATDQTAAGKLLLPTQLTHLKEIVQKKIPVLYLNAHPSHDYWNDYARAAFPEDFPRLTALGFACGDTPDRRNYYKQDAVANDVGWASMKQRMNKLGSLIDHLVTDKFATYPWTDSSCTSLDCAPAGFVTEVDVVAKYLKEALDNINTNQYKLFDSASRSKTLQSLVLWADVYRQSISYPLNKAGNQADFQKAYLADALVDYVRSVGAGQGTVGNFLSSEAQNTSTSSDFETITVSLPGKKGFTAVGRFALPGVPVEVKLVSMPDTGNFTLVFNTMVSGTTKVWETPTNTRAGYRRPQYLQSPAFNLSTLALTLVSPYGGTLELGFEGVSATSVTLQIKGTAKQAFYDTTLDTPNPTSFFNDVRTSKLGWLEIKTPGLEVHSLISNALGFLQPTEAQLADANNVFPNMSKPYYSRTSGLDMQKYLDEARKYVMEDAYQLAGFQTRGLALSSSIQSFCSAHNWDCTSTAVHVPPTVQHYLSDVRANCGSMCSGNPITSSSAFDPRHWGESHELGHNLQAFKLYDGISSEVSNNIFPLHKKWRLFRELGRSAVGYNNELNETDTVFALINAAYKNSNLSSTADKIASVKQALWTNSSYAAQNRARLYFYVQWPLVYFDALKERNPQLSDAQAWDQAWEIYSLMYLHLRQLNAGTDATWPSVKSNLGFSLYSSKPSTANADSSGNFPIHDVMLVSLSLITGRDQRPLFDLWGVTTTQAAKNQVGALGLSAQPVKFYAVVCSDDFRSFAAIDMNSASPGFPAAWGTSPFSSQNANESACVQATNSYLAKQ